MSRVKILTSIFQTCTKKQKKRLLDYHKSGKKFLCGENWNYFVKDNKG